jgi:hypothetical protein
MEAAPDTRAPLHEVSACRRSIASGLAVAASGSARTRAHRGCDKRGWTHAGILTKNIADSEVLNAIFGKHACQLDARGQRQRALSVMTLSVTFVTSAN